VPKAQPYRDDLTQAAGDLNGRHAIERMPDDSRVMAMPIRNTARRQWAPSVALVGATARGLGGEALTWRTAVGGALIVTAMLIVELAARHGAEAMLPRIECC
jgi:hypothetical protein